MTPARLLIVEDEAIVARDLSARLAGLGYTVVGTAATGADAVEMAGRLTPDLVLMDVRLPGEVDGIAAADRIRRSAQRPVVYVTGHADDATLARAGQTEPFGYVLKPFDERELRTVIEMALAKHRSDERLRESEERYATTLRSIGDGVIATDAAGRVTLLNPVAEGLTGWSQAEAAGRPLAEVFRVFHEATRQPVETPIARVLASGRGVGLSNATLLVRRDGAGVPIDNCAAPIRDPAGRMTGAVLVFRDVSARRKMEEDLRQAQKMEAVGRLAGGVAHDFNNLLTVIQGYAYLMTEALPAGHPARGYADEVLRAAEKAAGITSQLLTFSRKQQLRPRAFDLNRRVADLERLFSRLIGSHIQVVLDLPAGQGPVRADPGQVEQVIMNLVLNARDAMPHGGTLTIRTDTVVLTPNARAGLPLKAGTYRRLVVADTGVGMDEATRAQAFEPFFTTKEAGKGTGLGLATVYGIVQQSGGHITVDSALGRGTTFTVYLPAAVTVVAVEETPTPDVRPKGQETILLVEDEEGVRKLAKTLLEEAGYTVVAAKDGLEARGLAERAADFDLLLTDVVMPGLNGVDLWRRLSAERPGLKVLFTSGYADVGSRPGSELPGRLLLKPFKPDDLTRNVREVLDTA